MREHFFEKFTRSTEIIYKYPLLKIGTIDTITKVINLVRVIKEQKYHFESERIQLHNVQVISLLVHLQMNH